MFTLSDEVCMFRQNVSVGGKKKLTIYTVAALLTSLVLTEIKKTSCESWDTMYALLKQVCDILALGRKVHSYPHSGTSEGVGVRVRIRQWV